MSRIYSRTEIVTVVRHLTEDRLDRFIAAEALEPAHAEGFDEVERARITLLCELSDDFDVPDQALAMVMSLVDQLHGTRGSLLRLARALAEEPQEVRDRIGGRLR